MDEDDGGRARFRDDFTPLPQQQPWGRRAQSVAAVLWPSFLAAAVASLLFFAFVDPGAMQTALDPPLTLSRMAGYGLGFFFFWLIATGSSALSVFLLRTARRQAGNESRE